MKKEKSKKRSVNLKFDFGTILLITGAFANVTPWIGAFNSTEVQGPVSIWIHEYAIPVLGGISGLAMAFTVAFGLVYVFINLSKMQPTIERKVRGKDEVKILVNYRFWFAVVAVVVLLLVSPALLSPYVLMEIAGKSTMFSVLSDQWAWLWAVGRVAAADLALGAIALVYGAHLGASAMGAPATGSAKGASHSPKGASQSDESPKTPAVVMRTCEHGCGLSYRWPQGKGAHMKKYHPELCVVKGTPAGNVLPIKQTVEKRS